MVRELVDLAEEAARRHLVMLAEAMLDGDLSFLEGAPQMLELQWLKGDATEEDPDFDAFRLIESVVVPT